MPLDVPPQLQSPRVVAGIALVSVLVGVPLGVSVARYVHAEPLESPPVCQEGFPPDPAPAHAAQAREWNGHRYLVPRSPEELNEAGELLAERAIGDAKDLVLDGHYGRAVELLQTFPAELREAQAYSGVVVEVARFRRYQIYRDKLEAALQSDDETVIRFVKKILHEEVSEELLSLECNVEFLQRARARLGSAFDRILVR